MRTLAILGALLIASCGGGEDQWKVRDRDSGATPGASAQKIARDGVGYLALSCDRGGPLAVLIGTPVNVAPAGRRDPQPRTIHYRVDDGMEKPAEVHVLEDTIHIDDGSLPTILADIASASRLDVRTRSDGGGNLAMTVDLAGLAEARAEVEERCRG
ncbi:hypothetical protein RCO27_16755 [Sphingosinicella sp. LHD-64]|uniref:hypothetical protein n=1 Tax=Sphingosinicella sp. LHD-64 TaxID=3072139 RepID=UPI00280C9492|nr:hypothetical protein [Sphingosinicella sp. LHD-64]MDQ8757878.1 hypothetical protein [Sphingosinicella sp. LHD-64]